MSMRLEITQFIKHKEVSFDFKDGITLVKGPIASGKSTLLQAILWCIYGGNSNGKKRDVKLYYNNITIHRYSKPQATVKFTDQNQKIYNGDLAMDQIRAIFGQDDIFSICCVLNSRQGHPLIRGGASEKLYYLSKLAFKDRNDPMELINAIRLKTKEESSKYENELKVYEISINTLKEDIETAKTKFSRMAFDSSINELDKQIEAIELEISTLERAKWVNERDVAHGNKLKSILQTKDNTIQTLKDSIALLVAPSPELTREELKTKQLELKTLTSKRQLLFEHVSALQDSITMFYRQQGLRERWNRKAVLERQLGHLLASLTNPTTVEFNSIRRLESTYELNKDISLALGIDYCDKSISEEKKRLTSILSYLNMKQNDLKLKELTSKLSLIHKPNIKALEKHLYEIKAGINLMECPSCKTVLNYSKGTLTAMQSPIYTNLDLQKAEIELKNARLTQNARNAIKEQIANLKSILIEFEEQKDKNIFKRDDIIDRLTKLEKVIIVPKPNVSSAEYELLLEYKDIKNISEPTATTINVLEVELELSNKKKLLNDIYNALNSLLLVIEALERRLKLELERCLELENMNKMLASTSAECTVISTELMSIQINDVSDTLRNAYISKKQLYDASFESKQITLLRNRAAFLSDQKVLLDEKAENVVALTNLYNITVTEHYNQLKRVVDAINSLITYHSAAVLNQPLKVSFELQSVTKYGDYKNDIRLLIIDNQEENTIDRVSYGQMEQISLLIVMCLNSLQKAPIMIFDEAMGRFNPEARLKCLQNIRNSLRGKIIMAEHYAEEADYDQTIELGET